MGNLEKTIVGIGCISVVLNMIIYGLGVWAVYWVLHHMLNVPFIFAIILAFLVLSVLGAIKSKLDA